MDLIQGGREAGFATIKLMRRTRERIEPMDLVETYAALVLDGRKSEAPDVLWGDFGEQTIAAIADGCRTLAMLWESAWVEGGGSDTIPEAQLTMKNRFNIKQIYDRQTFAPSVPLGPSDDGSIDAYL